MDRDPRRPYVPTPAEIDRLIATLRAELEMWNQGVVNW